jgi:hypothetical protein
MEWRQRLASIRELELRILRTEPFRDFGLVPNPSATESAIAAAEARIGRALPPSYREFLAQHDGWTRFYEGASLLGTASLGLPLYGELTRSIFASAETPVPDLAPPSRSRSGPERLIPFGVDADATTVFAFDADRVDANGELEVVCWINEIGVKRESFSSFLEFIEELCEAELANAVSPTLKDESAVVPHESNRAPAARVA